MFSGERICLRAVEEEDLSTLHEWLSDPEVLADNLTGPLTLRSKAANLAMLRGLVEESTLTAFAVERLEDGLLIGECTLRGYTAANRCGALGIILGRAYWNQGYGTEALKLVLAYAFNELNLHRVQLEVNADNARGIRAYEKAGFVQEGRAREAYFRAGAWRDTVYMGVLRDEFGRP